MTRRSWSHGLSVLLLAAGVLTACSWTANPAKELKEAVEDYTRAMRWGHVEKAAAYVPDPLRAAFIRQKRMAQAQVQIHEYDVRAVEYTRGADRARVIILAVWSRPTDPVAHQQMIAQEWRYRQLRWEMTHQSDVQQIPVGMDAVEPKDAL